MAPLRRQALVPRTVNALNECEELRRDGNRGNCALLFVKWKTENKSQYCYTVVTFCTGRYEVG